MTEQTETATGTALAQVADGVLARVQGNQPFTVSELADLMARPPARLPQGNPLPGPAPQVNFTDKLRRALKGLPAVFGVVMPTERRKLESAELVRLTEEIITIDVLLDELTQRREAIKEVVRIHQDFEAEAEGITERVAEGAAKGHYLAGQPGKPFKTAVEGYADPWQQRYVKGGTSQQLSLLQELLDAGTITQAEFNGFTRAVRVLDEDKIRAAIRQRPRRSLQILSAITRRSAPGASLYAPKK